MSTAPAEAVAERLLPRPRHYGLADTGPRFALLMTVVTASSVNMLDTVLAPAPNDTSGDELGCLLAAGMDPDGRNVDNLLATLHRSKALVECASGVPTVEHWKGLVATLVLLVVAALAYWWQPRLRERWRRTVPAEALDPDGTLVAALRELRELSGVTSDVRFRVDPTRTTAGAVVYGRLGKYTVCLHAGLLVRRATDPEGFRAVVLHELAHVRNRDVDYASASTALWRVFVVLALLPYLWHQGGMLLEGLTGRSDSPFWPGVASGIVYSLLTGLLLVGLVHLARADLLRHRELHADARAVSSGAQPSAWPHRDDEGAVAGSVRRITASLRTHPSWAERRRALAEPGRLSGVSALALFLLGVSGTLLINAARDVVPQLSTSRGTTWIATAFIAPVLWVSLTRSVAAAQASGRAESGLRAGLWLGCGLVLGEVVGGKNGNEWLGPEPQLLLGLLLSAAAAAAWSAQCARLTLDVARTWPRRTAGLLNLLVTASLLWGGMYWWYLTGWFQSMGVYSQSDQFRDQLTQSAAGSWKPYSRELSAAADNLPTLTTLNAGVLLAGTALLLWLFPLVLRAWTSEASGLRLGRTLAAGTAGGLLCWAVLLAVLHFQHGRRPATVAGRAGPYALVHGWLLIGGIIAACLLTAAAVAAVSRRFWLLRALLAVAVTQLLGQAAVFVLVAADGCLGPFSALADQCHWVPRAGRLTVTLLAMQVLTPGVLLAACAAVAGAGAGWAVRRLARRHGERPPSRLPTPAPNSRWRRLAPTAAVLALAAPMALLSTAAHTHTDGTRSSSSRTGAPGDPVIDVVDAAPRAGSARIRAAQAAAWLAHGGIKHFGAIGKSVGELGETLTTAAGQEPGTSGEVRLDSKKISRICGTMAERAEDALAYFPVPDQSLQKRWSASLAGISRAGRTCRAALTLADHTYKTDADRKKAFWTSLDEITKAEKALVPLLDDIKKAAAPAMEGGDI